MKDIFDRLIVDWTWLRKENYNKWKQRFTKRMMSTGNRIDVYKYEAFLEFLLKGNPLKLK